MTISSVTGDHDIIVRWTGNPVISLDHLSFPALNIINAGAVLFKNQWLLLVRVETLKGRSVFVVARSTDGLHFTMDRKPILESAKSGKFKEYEERGVEDPRITYLEGTYYIVYTGLSWHGHRLILAKTKDFRHIERIAIFSEPGNKNGMLFPRKIKGDYVRVERPESGYNAWISYSKDLLYWGRGTILLKARGSGYWDAHRVGGSVPPIEIDEGWLLIYYGERDTSGGPLYRLGAAILDREDPAKVLHRSDIPILAPRESYERVGDVNNKVFSCGAIVNKATQELFLYYGAADNVLCLGTAKLSDICSRCFENENGNGKQE